MLSCHISEHSFSWSIEEELVEDSGIQDSSGVFSGNENWQSAVIPLSSKKREQAFFKKTHLF